MTRPTFSPQISLGNVIQIAVVMFGIAAGWQTLSSKVDTIEKTSAQVQLDYRAHGERIRALENEQARADERFSSILSMLARIDNRLERIERGAGE